MAEIAPASGKQATSSIAAIITIGQFGGFVAQNTICGAAQAVGSDAKLCSAPPFARHLGDYHSSLGRFRLEERGASLQSQANIGGAASSSE